MVILHILFASKLIWLKYTKLKLFSTRSNVENCFVILSQVHKKRVEEQMRRNDFCAEIKHVPYESRKHEAHIIIESHQHHTEETQTDTRLDPWGGRLRHPPVNEINNFLKTEWIQALVKRINTHLAHE